MLVGVSDLLLGYVEWCSRYVVQESDLVVENYELNVRKNNLIW